MAISVDGIRGSEREKMERDRERGCFDRTGDGVCSEYNVKIGQLSFFVVVGVNEYVLSERRWLEIWSEAADFRIHNGMGGTQKR